MGVKIEMSSDFRTLIFGTGFFLENEFVFGSLYSRKSTSLLLFQTSSLIEMTNTAGYDWALAFLL